jgi:hypothetical protein
LPWTANEDTAGLPITSLCSNHWLALIPVSHEE